MSTQKASVKKAFTLTELLVSMAVLGLIATLTLPHMFMSADRAKKRAAFKEAYQAIAEAVQQTALEGGKKFDIINKLHPSKICMDHARNQGCTTSANPEANSAGIVLATGVSLFGFNGGNPDGATDGFMIGLEDFPKKEYFNIHINIGDKPINMTHAIPTDEATGLPWVDPGQVPVNSILRPGEARCSIQACLDMFKND